jgi:hypothetical protein
MVTKQQYIEYLVSMPVNYTRSNLAEHLNGASYDVVTDYLSRHHLTSQHVWVLAKQLIMDSSTACLIVDDKVQDNRYSYKIEVVKAQTKIDHFREMLLNAFHDKQLQAQTVLFDTWYALEEFEAHPPY